MKRAFKTINTLLFKIRAREVLFHFHAHHQLLFHDKRKGENWMLEINYILINYTLVNVIGWFIYEHRKSTRLDHTRFREAVLRLYIVHQEKVGR